MATQMLPRHRDEGEHGGEGQHGDEDCGPRHSLGSAASERRNQARPERVARLGCFVIVDRYT